MLLQYARQHHFQRWTDVVAILYWHLICNSSIGVRLIDWINKPNQSNGNKCFHNSLLRRKGNIQSDVSCLGISVLQSVSLRIRGNLRQCYALRLSSIRSLQ